MQKDKATFDIYTDKNLNEEVKNNFLRAINNVQIVGNICDMFSVKYFKTCFKLLDKIIK